MNRAARQRRTNGGRGADLAGGDAFGGWRGRFGPARRRTFHLGLGNGWGRRAADRGGGKRAPIGLGLGGFAALRFGLIGLVGDVIGNIVPIEAAKPDGRVLVD